MFGPGILAALTSPLVLNIGFIIWQDHWKGSAFSLNLYKCNVASLGFLVLSCTTRSNLFPSSIFTTQAVGYLILSSLIGIVIGDWAWLRGLQLLGARRTILMDSIKPFLASLLGYLVLNERLRPAALGGIVLTVLGVLLVAMETTKDEAEEIHDVDKPFTIEMAAVSPIIGNEASSETVSDNEPPIDSGKDEIEDLCSQQSLDCTVLPMSDLYEADESAESVKGEIAASAEQKVSNTKPKRRTAKKMRLGYVLSLLNAGLDTYGAVLTKQYGIGMTVWEISLIRFGFAGLVMLGLSTIFWLRARLLHPQDLSTSESCPRDSINEAVKAATPWYALPIDCMQRSNWIRVTIGVLLVTFVAPSLFNYALFQIALALTLTLTSVGPLYSLPLEYCMQQETPSVRAVAGALLAVSGIVVLAFKGPIPNE
ncbi:hypothetical protein MPSEU_000690300 [Mayamaea pseudoterrestris]|nr:hypothetical protein MPSEU_000690300 [Mayamaea pseudoterrestris]